MVDPKKVANNILDFLIDPTRIPVQERVYFRPEEKLQNESYEKAKADAFVAYKDQKHNSDFYPQRNRSLNKEAMMDRRSLIASLDVLSKNFREDDPISVDLRAMAAAVSKMQDEELSGRLAEGAPDLEGTLVEAKAETFPCPKCGTKVLKQTGFCVKCKKKVKPKSAADEEAEEPKEEAPKAAPKDAPKEEEEAPEKKEPEEKEEAPEEAPADEKDAFITTESPREIGQRPRRSPMDLSLYNTVKKHEKELPPDVQKALKDYAIFEKKVKASEEYDFWTKEATDLVRDNLISDVIGADADEEPEPVEEKVEEKDEKDAAKACPMPKKEEEEVDAAKKVILPPAPAPEMKEDEKDAAKIPEMKEEKKEDEKDAAKACPVPEKKEEEKDAAKKDEKKEEVIPPPDKESKVVDTNVLASVYYEGIELPTGLMTADEVGELTAKEKEELSKLF